MMKKTLHSLLMAVSGLVCLLALPSCEGIRMKYAMLEAAERGDVQTVQLMLDKGVPIDSRRGDWRTALHQAARNGHYETCKKLIEYGADVNATDRVVNRHYVDTGEVISYWYDTPLQLAAYFNHADVCQLLINHGAMINKKNSEGYTPLKSAIENGAEEAARVLIRNGGTY